MTGELEERLRKHNSKSKGFTNRAKDWKFVYSKTFEKKSDALIHEKELKGWKSKIRIQQFLKEIENQN
jgi:putative endonuclease